MKKGCWLQTFPNAKAVQITAAKGWAAAPLPLRHWALRASAKGCSYSTTTSPDQQSAANSKPRFKIADRISTFGGTVWSEMTPLAVKYQAVQLGQGFPDFPAPDFVLEAGQEAIKNNLNQYTRMLGHPRLVKELAKTYSPLFEREIDPMSEVIVTIGCTEGLFASISALVEPGDEVLLLEPFYDAYPCDIELNGGKSVYVPLRPPQASKEGQVTYASDWKLDFDELEGAVTPKTKMIIVNNPMNVIGKVWTREELESIAKIAKRHNLIVLSDEVYEWMTYDDSQHVRMASLPDMWERTITFGSAGKTFSVTGWKVGWAFGPSYFINAMGLIHQFDSFTHGTPLQEGIAVALEQSPEKNYFPELKQMYWKKRDRMVEILKECGLSPVVPQGAYFVLADTSAIDEKRYIGKGYEEGQQEKAQQETRDYHFCRWLTKEIGVGAIPPSAFYCNEHAHLAERFARFAFCKRDEVFEAARSRLQKLNKPPLNTSFNF